jgi:hypothetical protein
MAIELSSLKFTNKADIVPQSGTGQILNTGIANTLDGKDIITGTSTRYDFNTVGINNYYGAIYTGDGDDIITGTATDGWGYGIQNYNAKAIIDTGAGKDTITAKASTYGIYNIDATINTGAGGDTITATGGDTGIVNGGTINTGDGSDIITGTATGGSGIGGIFNNIDGTINTGNGNDIITGTGGTGIYNDGTIDTENGNDSIIADGGFNGIGRVFLGDGKDYLKGFGNGNFNGGNDKDTLELTSGSYTVGISGTTVSFTNGSTIMNTSEFEKLIAGNKTYDFSRLTNNQTIIVA